MHHRPLLVLLGPQRFEPTVHDTLVSEGIEGPVAVITAGWQEREAEVEELRAHLGRETRNLELYRRYDDVVLRDAELGAALRERQDLLQQLQSLYRERLGYALDAVRRLMAREADGPFLAEHRRAAIRAVRTLDRQHVTRQRALHERFDATWRPAERPAVARHLAEIRALVQGCSAMTVAGGHVAVLLSRMRLFDIRPLAAERLVVAWSAGAMALSERVVLFHDSPPQGAGNAEVLDVGLGVFRNLVALPHAGKRLQLDDPLRVAIFARRFSPADCVTLDPGARLDWDGRHWRANETTQRLKRGGGIERLVAP